MERNEPNTQRRLICQSCGAPFGCSSEAPGGCWCFDVKVSETALAALKAKYGDCICPVCLEKEARASAIEP